MHGLRRTLDTIIRISKLLLLLSVVQSLLFIKRRRPGLYKIKAPKQTKTKEKTAKGKVQLLGEGGVVEPEPFS